MNTMEDYELENTHGSVTKASLTFLLEGTDPRDLAEDGLSITSFADSEAGGVREPPSCQELAIEGERLAKQGEHREAIPLLEAALEAGTDDERLISVLWSLLGNAHFYLGNYKQASLCHTHDLAVSCETGDDKSQAQAYCNLGIAYRKTGGIFANSLICMLDFYSPSSQATCNAQKPATRATSTFARNSKRAAPFPRPATTWVSSTLL